MVLDKNEAAQKDGAPALVESIAARLLRIIFGCYFVVTVVVTGIRLTAEYLDTEDRLVREIDAMQQTFGPGISDAVWRYNVDILSGMKALPIVVGVKVENDNAQIAHAVGVISDARDRKLKADASGALKAPKPVDKGQEIARPMGGVTRNGSGYDRVGEVFRDPKTGKLVLIEPAAKSATIRR
jgi:hypothetical protein